MSSCDAPRLLEPTLRSLAHRSHGWLLQAACALGCAVALGALSSSALAAPGDHIRAGDATFSPGLDFGGEYRTNLYRAEADPTGGANLRIAPRATFSVGGEDHEFSFGGVWELRKFLFVDEVAGSTLTSAERVSSLDRFNDFGLNTSTTLFKREVVGLELSDSLNLRNNSTDAEFSEAPFTTQLRNSLTGGLRISPGPALSIVPGGKWSYDQYRVPSRPGDEDRVLNSRNAYGPTLGAKWSFLPRTAVYANADYTVNSWTAGPVQESSGGLFEAPGSQFIRAMTGIDGRFTNKLFLNIGAGYGVGLYESGNNISGLDGLLAKVQGRYQIVEGTEDQAGTSITLGYEKTFRDSFFTNSVAINRGYTGLGVGIGNFVPSVQYEVRAEDYDGAIARNDIVNKLSLNAGYRIQNWASITPGVSWQQRASNQDNVEYDDVNIRLLANFTY